MQKGPYGTGLNGTPNRFIGHITITLLFWFAVISGNSQSPTFLPLTKLALNEGLSSPNVRKLVADRYGFIWIATQYGLNRFDGASFIQFVPNALNPARSISGSGDVFDLAAGTGNELWAITAYGSLYEIDITSCVIRKEYKVPALPGKNATPWLTCMDVSGRYLFIGSRDSTVFRFDLSNKRFDRSIRLEQLNPAKQGPVNKLKATSSGDLWILMENQGALITDLSLSTKQNLVDFGHSTIRFTGIEMIKDQVLITSSKGLYTIAPNGRHQSAEAWLPELPDSISGRNIQTAFYDGHSTLTLASNQRLYEIDLGKKNVRTIRFSKNYEDQKWLLVTNCLLRTGNSIWFGSQYGLGWVRDVYTPFTGYFTSMDGSGHRIEHSITICGLNDTLAAVCSDDGLYLTNLSNGKIRKRFANDVFYTVFKGPGNNIIASAVDGGLHMLDKNGNVELPLPPELNTIKNDLLISAISYRDSLYFMASQNERGLYIWDPAKKTIETISTSSYPNALRTNVINRLYLDRHNRLWIVCDDAVSVYDPLRKTMIHPVLLHPQTKRPLNIMMDVCEFGNDYWLAVYGVGVVRLSEEFEIRQIISSREGINNLGLYKIFPLNEAALIVSSNNGLSVIQPASGRVKNYFEYDGLQSSSFEETSGFLHRDYILMGGTSGFTRIDPSRIRLNKLPPAIFFSNITMLTDEEQFDSLHLFHKKLNVPSDVIRVLVSFSALNFSYPEKLVYQYRIKELNEHWTATGAKNEVALTGLSPGTYHLQVKAANEDGIWSETIEMTLVFLPKWYQTLWFKLLIGAAFIGIVYGLYRLRIRQLKKEQMIRTKLASDLHDDLGSTLNSVKVYANLALMKKGDEKYLQQVKDTVQEAIAGVKDMIWVLDDKKNTVDDLVTRINQFAVPVCEANGISYQTEISTEARPYKLSQEEKRNLYLISKEFINNTIKYSNAGQLSLFLSCEKGKLQLILRDNGKGFDPQTVQEGNGLKNMRFRAGQINYRVRILPEYEKGTSVHLSKN